MADLPTKDCVEIVYAHDEQQITKLFLAMFEDHIQDGAVKIHTAQSKYEIVEKVRSNSIDILIIDEGLTHLDTPKTFNKLKAANPDLKVLYLLKRMPNKISMVNSKSTIQYCNKPFKVKNLYQQILDIHFSDALKIKNLIPAQLFYLLSVMESTSNVCLQSADNHSSGEVFIVDRKIISASVEGSGKLLSDDMAVEQILKWKNFESNYGDAFFPEDESIQLDPYQLLISEFKPDEKMNNEALNTDPVPTVKVTAEMKKKLREYLSMASYALSQDFVMNAFCNYKCEMFVSIKHPDLQEKIYKLGDIIINTFLRNSTRMKRSFLNQDVVRLDLEYFMAIYRMDNNFWYFTILKNDQKIAALNEIVSEFSYHTIRVLYGSKSSVEQLLEEVA
jgi:hypothetical protein